MWFQVLEPEFKDSMAAQRTSLLPFLKWVRDCVDRLKQYITRCPIEKKPSQSKLISIFLEDLKDKTLYKHLYAKKHQSFIECCIDPMDFDENFDDSEDTTSESARTEVRLPRRVTNTDTTSSTRVTTDQIVDTVL